MHVSGLEVMPRSLDADDDGNGHCRPRLMRRPKNVTHEKYVTCQIGLCLRLDISELHLAYFSFSSHCYG